MITRIHTLPGDRALGKAVVEFLYSDYKDYDTLRPSTGAKPGGPAPSSRPPKVMPGPSRAPCAGASGERCAGTACCYSSSSPPAAVSQSGHNHMPG